VTQIRCYETIGRPVFITGVLHRRIPYLKNLVGQVAPQALPDAYETTKFLSRLDWPFFLAGGWAEALNCYDVLSPSSIGNCAVSL
jgi:hypothetical protein